MSDKDEVQWWVVYQQWSFELLGEVGGTVEVPCANKGLAMITANRIRRGIYRRPEDRNAKEGTIEVVKCVRVGFHDWERTERTVVG